MGGPFGQSFRVQWWRDPVLLISAVWPLLAVLVGLLFVLLVIVLLVMWSRRRERMMTEALRAGQPDIALRIVEGPGRLFSAVILIAFLVLTAMAMAAREEELALAFALAALVPLYLLFRPSKVKKLTGPPYPPPAARTAPPGQGPATSPPGSAPGPSPGPPPPRDYQPAEDSNGLFEVVMVVALAIVVVFARLVAIDLSPWLVLLVGVLLLAYFVSGRKRRARCARFLGRQAGKVRDWLMRQAGNGGD